LSERGVIRGYGPDIAPAALGYGVTAFVTLEIRQSRGHDPVAVHLATIPEVLEAHTITGSGDLMCRIVARSNADLQRVIDQVVSYPDIMRASTIIALAEQIPYRTLPLVDSVAGA
jgi:DNA-binding Lrp family transcriptional regulator